MLLGRARRARSRRRRRPPRPRSRRRARSPAGSNPSRASDANATALAATWSFMSSAPRPHTSPSTRSPDHGLAIPLARIGEHGVRVTEKRERRAVSALDPRDEVRPLGHARVQLGLDPVPREVVAQNLAACVSFPGGLTVSSRRSACRSAVTSSRSVIGAAAYFARGRPLLRSGARARQAENAPLAVRLRPSHARRARRAAARPRIRLGAQASRSRRTGRRR